MALAFLLLFVTLHLAAMRNEIMRRRVRTMLMLQSRKRPGADHEPWSTATFIPGAYGAAALIVIAMVAWVVIDHWRQARALAELEARGVTRRSSESPGRATSGATT